MILPPRRPLEEQDVQEIQWRLHRGLTLRASCRHLPGLPQVYRRLKGIVIMH